MQGNEERGCGQIASDGVSVHRFGGRRPLIQPSGAGANHYVTKPFAVGELAARLRAALRRTAKVGPEAVYEVGDLRVDLGRRQVSLTGQEVALTPTEWELLRALAQHGGRVLTHRQLLRQVWGASYEPETHLLRSSRQSPTARPQRHLRPG